MPIEGSQQGPKFAPVILAGGSGTRFWPRSRKARAKQVLALDGERTMIQQTVDRLTTLGGHGGMWVITNDLLADLIAGQVPEIPRRHILSEPAARNTAPACALAAFLLETSEPETVIGIFPSDHVVKNAARFAEVVACRHWAGCERRQDGCVWRSSNARGDGIRIHRAWREGREPAVRDGRDCRATSEAVYREAQCCGC